MLSSASNPALLLFGSWVEISYAIATVVLSGAYLAWAAEGSVVSIVLTRAERLGVLILAAIIGTSTLWLGSDSPFNLAVLAGGGLLVLAFRRFAAARPQAPAGSRNSAGPAAQS